MFSVLPFDNKLVVRSPRGSDLLEASAGAPLEARFR